VSSSALSTKSHKDIAIVLRTQPLGEADRIIILLTRERGIVHAVAKGIRRSSSKFGARLEPFMLIDVSLVAGKNLETVSQVQTRRAYTSSIMGDYSAYLTGLALVEITEQLSVYDAETYTESFNLLAGALSAIARNVHQPIDVLNSFISRMMRLSGWDIQVYQCSVCGRQEDINYFSASSSGICTSCASMVGEKLLAFSDDVKSYIDDVSSGRWEQVDSQIQQSIKLRSLELLTRYLQWHVEKPIRSIEVALKDFHAS
jgi:DNA repair protein RecO (recombination protein O)